MADVGPRTDRGQIIVITALVVAVLFVGLALVLNSAIYTENLSTRETGEPSSAVLQERHVTEDDLQFQIDRANENILEEDGVEFEDATTSFEKTVSSYAKSKTTHQARDGRILAVHTDEPIEGSYIKQQSEGNFTAGGEIESEPDWKLAENVTEAGTFEMRINRESLLQLSDGLVSDGTVEHILDAAFHVKITTEDDEWRVFVFQEPDGNISVRSERGEEGDILDRSLDTFTSEDCETDTDAATVDLVSGTLNGEECGQLDFYEEDVIGDEHDLEYRNARSTLTEVDALDDLLDLNGDPGLLDINEDEGDRVDGSYEIVVDRPVDNLDEHPYYGPGAGEPTSQSILYSASIHNVYRNVGAELVVEDHEVKWSKVDA